MPPPTKDIHRNEYTVGWICALPVEFSAAVAMLDESHQCLEQDNNGGNEYAFGRIAQHNVVIATLPADPADPIAAKAVTEQMKATFPALRLVLQIGVGAGISGAQANIHLGDMLINRSNKSYNKALRYDDEKSIISAYELDASLNAPPQFISNPIMKLNEPGTRSSSTTIPRQNLPSNLYHSNQSDIVLFEAHYNHIERGGGLQCDFARQIYEEEMTGWPVENYGTTGLNNQVMEDVAARSDVFYFEMESSGIATSFLCLVIRAIYNYSDSISCKKRQPCKWGIASLFAKELLSIISRDELAEINSVGEFAKAIAKIRNIENNWDNNIRELGGLEHCCG
ncbi:uncharacterized protein TRIVIDRAFT_29593 [Trichoderma virens Gv29-8]|uniref:Nucleoside phosphorylase domain-containing protein n=1 Tax=Hypocrea virens (strain Gv29-8 / FGSC 10586) TaxID=413071 RepID=G9MS52_HYPVG|nr:uncharacterized protein TRIVIDRAFT_29593 [Trichoderma virens Gv29-8]EHK22919.1 hypothetical protein TRIVIDRAFT_29593 [Trichoderma virens Gv29-8]